MEDVFPSFWHEVALFIVWSNSLSIQEWVALFTSAQTVMRQIADFHHASNVDLIELFQIFVRGLQFKPLMKIGHRWTPSKHILTKAAGVLSLSARRSEALNHRTGNPASKQTKDVPLTVQWATNPLIQLRAWRIIHCIEQHRATLSSHKGDCQLLNAIHSHLASYILSFCCRHQQGKGYFVLPSPPTDSEKYAKRDLERSQHFFTSVQTDSRLLWWTVSA